MAGAANKSSSGGIIGKLIVLAILLVLVRSCYNGFTEKPGTTTANATPVEQPDPKAVALRATSISKFNWYKDGFGSVMTAAFTIKNDGDEDVKDIEIKFVHSAPSGTVIDSNTRTIYEIVPAHKSRTFRNFDMGFINSQASSSSCGIEDLALR
jgi:hypothetical protein